MDPNRRKEQKKKESTKNGSPVLLNRSSLTSRLSTASTEVKGISRKEFKPTIPARRKKHSANPAKSEPLHPPPTTTDKTVTFDQRLKERLAGKPNTPESKDRPKGKFRKEYIRSSTGLFGGNEAKLETDDPFASARTVAELEEEKYVDPFLQSTNELTPVTLPINPRIDSKSKLSVGKKDTAVSDSHQETTVAELLYRPPEDTTESTYLFNLPDLFPVDMSKLDLDDKGEQADRKATIHELPEGYLGRLQILKSGRARLMVGDVPFDVNLNSKSGFLQEILCCQTQALDRGIVANIGTVPYALSVSPEFDQLIT
ncbi:uncharacterized protein LOC134822662 isoform X1 [Bolinopsis microptera]|uniref:uncharacterized protein LOC134822662 isoform X1 n=1 Tax=Bolinopsis microptera TaxID=2820187 RepID=UPI0030799B40